MLPPGITRTHASSEETGKASLAPHPVSGFAVVAGCPSVEDRGGNGEWHLHLHRGSINIPDLAFTHTMLPMFKECFSLQVCTSQSL